MFGSGTPSFADTVISRASLENSLERAASWRPLRCMMFLNCEWPAMASSGGQMAPRASRCPGHLRRMNEWRVISRHRGEIKEGKLVSVSHDASTDEGF